MQIPGVLDDLYRGSAAERTLGVDLAAAARRRSRCGRRPRRTVDLLVWSGRRRRRAAACRCAATTTASWSVDGSTVLEGRAVPVRGHGLRADDRQGRDERGHRPVLGRADARTRRARCWSTWPTRRCAPAQWRDAAQPKLAQAGRLDDLRAARPRLLDQRQHGAGRAPRDLPGLRRRAATGTKHLRGAGGGRAEHRAPAADVRHRRRSRRTGPTSRRRPATCASFAAGLRAAAGLRDRGGRRRTASTGATTRTTGRRPRARTRPTRTARPASREFRTMVGALHDDGLRVVLDQVLQPHRRRPGRRRQSVLDQVVPGYYQRLNADRRRSRPRPAARTSPPSTRWREKLHGRLGGQLGARLQGRRLPVRPDGPPLARRTCWPSAHALDELTLAEDGVDGKSIYLYGEGWNFGEVADNALFVPGHPGPARRHRDRHVQRPAARRGARRRAVRRRPADPGLRLRRWPPTRTATAINGTPAEQRRRLAARHGPDQARPGRQPARLHLPRRATGDVVRGDAGRLQRSAGRVRRPAGRGDQLRRRARQRDAVGRADLQAADGHVDGRTGSG